LYLRVSVKHKLHGVFRISIAHFNSEGLLSLAMSVTFPEVDLVVHCVVLIGALAEWGARAGNA